MWSNFWPIFLVLGAVAFVLADEEGHIDVNREIVLEVQKCWDDGMRATMDNNGLVVCIPCVKRSEAREAMDEAVSLKVDD